MSRAAGHTRAAEPVNNTRWREGALHVSVPDRGTFRLEPDGTLRRLAAAAPMVWAARDAGGGRTLLLTSHGPRWWTGEPRRFERPPAYEDHFPNRNPR